MEITQKWEYEHLCDFREEKADDLTPWFWIKKDNGGWEGPKLDWENSHKEKVLKYCNKFDCCISAGGNMGMYPRFYSDMFRQVYTFEPHPLNFFCLVQNTQRDNIIKIQAALGESNKMVKLCTIAEENMGMVAITESRPDDCHIPMLRIDDFHFNNLDLIHLDLEGYELQALTGAVRNIQQHRPLIFAERGDDGNFQSFFDQYGYRKVDKSVSDTVWKYDK